MRYNLNAGYGMAVAARLTAFQASGKTFIVQPTTYPNADMITEIFQPDYDGVVRVFNTISTALAACTAGNGDVIYVAPGHTETITAAGGITVSQSGVSIIGIGNGNLRPIINFTTSTAATFLVSGNNVTIQNMIFTCGINAQVTMISSTGTDFIMNGCYVNVATAGAIGAVIGVTCTGARPIITGNTLIGDAATTGSTATGYISYAGILEPNISSNFMAGKATQLINNTATALRGFIDSNKLVVGTGTVAINLSAASTQFITNNRMNVASGTAPVVAAAGFVSGNTYSAAAGVTAGVAGTF
jgi:hypothetical protein